MKNELKEIKKMFLEDFEVYKDGANKGKINIEKSIGKSIRFVYNNIQGEILIKDYNYKNKQVKVEYNNEEFSIPRQSLINANLGKLLKAKSKEFKFEIGQIFKDDKRDLVIIGREYRQKQRKRCVENVKYYKYHCNKCKYEGWKLEGSLKSGGGCACCSGDVCVKGINDIATTDPWMCNYIVNEEDWYNYTSGSGANIPMKCPLCGSSKCYSINELKKRKRLPCNCEDGVSYPEKFIKNIFNQLEVDNIWQVNKKHLKWCKNYYYDFYFRLEDEEFIIETHGGQHYKENTDFEMTLEQVKENDKYKYELAISNGIKPENYIIIDFRESTLKWGKEHILNSRLAEIFDLSSINWKECEEYALKNIIKEVCDYLNNNKTSINQLSMLFNLTEGTIRRYLKKGRELGYCDFINKFEQSDKQTLIVANYWNNLSESDKNIKNLDEMAKELKLSKDQILYSLNKGNKLGMCNYSRGRNKMNGKKIMIIDKEGTIIGKYSSVEDLIRNSKDIFKEQITRYRVNKIIDTEELYNGYIIRSIDK